MHKLPSILWLTVKIAILTLLMDAGRVAFIYQNF
jgi:hypothetical protein